MAVTIKNASRILLLIVVAVMIQACNHDRNHPGWSYMPDMYYSEPYDAYTANPKFTDSLTMQTPVKGTISRGQMPYPYQVKSYTDQIRAGAELTNPVPLTPSVLAEGKAHYEIHCMACHGREGKGDGYLYSGKLFPAKPTSLVENFVQGKPDGEIFHVITTGSLSGLMGAHGTQITSDNRWKIIHYIRELSRQ